MRKIIIILCALMVCIGTAAPSGAGEWVTFKSVSKSSVIGSQSIEQLSGIKFANY